MNVFIIAAITADGFIGRSAKNRSFNWTSEEDKRFYVESIKKADVIVMGRETFGTFRRHPKGSNWVIYTSRPEDFVNHKPNVITATATNEAPDKLLEKLEKEGHKNIAICGGRSIYSMFMEVGVVDKLYLTVESIVFGKGVSLFDKKLDIKLKLVKSENLSDQTILLEYDVLR